MKKLLSVLALLLMPTSVLAVRETFSVFWAQPGDTVELSASTDGTACLNISPKPTQIDTKLLRRSDGRWTCFRLLGETGTADLFLEPDATLHLILKRGNTLGAYYIVHVDTSALAKPEPPAEEPEQAAKSTKASPADNEKKPAENMVAPPAPKLVVPEKLAQPTTPQELPPEPVLKDVPNWLDVQLFAYPEQRGMTIGYVITNRGNVPVVVDPSRLDLFADEINVHGSLTRTSLSGYAGWVAPGKSEFGSIYVPWEVLAGKQTLTMRWTLYALYEVPQPILLKYAWTIPGM